MISDQPKSNLAEWRGIFFLNRCIPQRLLGEGFGQNWALLEKADKIEAAEISTRSKDFPWLDGASMKVAAKKLPHKGYELNTPIVAFLRFVVQHRCCLYSHAIRLFLVVVLSRVHPRVAGSTDDQPRRIALSRIPLETCLTVLYGVVYLTR